jgi:seryl-tRNA synthetase
MSEKTATIDTLEQQLKAATETAQLAQKAEREARQAEKLVGELKAQIANEKAQEIHRAAMQNIETGLVSIRESGDRVNELSEALKAELQQFNQLSSEVNRAAHDGNVIGLQTVVFSSYSVENLPAVFWNEASPVTPVFMTNRGSARNDFYHNQNVPSEPYGDRLKTLSNLD